MSNKQASNQAMGNACDKMADGIWLGDKGVYDPENPEYKRFPTIISALTHHEIGILKLHQKVGGSPNWLHVPVEDDERTDISHYFLHVNQHIEAARARGEDVLVHCAGGVSRSATLMIAYLMWKHGWSRKQAVEYVVARRRVVSPNDGFMDQLLEFEGMLGKLQDTRENPHVYQQVNNDPE